MGAYFTSSIAAITVREVHKKNLPLSDAIVELGKYTAPIAEEGGLGRPAQDIKTAIGTVLKSAENFAVPGILSNFFRGIFSLFSLWLRNESSARSISSSKTRLAEIWKTEINKAFASQSVYNISVQMVFERLALDLKKSMALLD